MNPALSFLILLAIILSPMAFMPMLKGRVPTYTGGMTKHTPIGSRGSAKTPHTKIRPGITPEKQAKIMAGCAKQQNLIQRGIENKLGA